MMPKNFGGEVVVYPHADDAVVAKLLDAGRAVVAMELFMSDDFKSPAGITPTKKRRPDPDYAGFTLGYERGVIANRVHDILSALALARGLHGARSVHLIGVGEAGPAALIARGLAGDAVERAAIDLNGFDFDKVKTNDDAMLLPGALKYGGVWGLVPLCARRATLVCNGPAASPATERAKRAGKVEIATEAMDAGRMAQWVVEEK
jgi:hypothetical protein